MACLIFTLIVFQEQNKLFNIYQGGIILVLRAGVETLKLQKYAQFIGQAGQAFPINPRRKRALFIRRFEQNTG